MTAVVHGPLLDDSVLDPNDLAALRAVAGLAPSHSSTQPPQANRQDQPDQNGEPDEEGQDHGTQQHCADDDQGRDNHSRDLYQWITGVLRIMGTLAHRGIFYPTAVHASGNSRRTMYPNPGRLD